MGYAFLLTMDLQELQTKIDDYIRSGYYQDVAKAAREAQKATRDYIARTHPSTAFGGKSLAGKQIIIGKYDVEVSKIVTNIYANYFSRWYNTGTFGRVIKKSGPRMGMRGPSYPSRGAYFESNKAAIEDYFATQLERYLERHMSFLK